MKKKILKCIRIGVIIFSISIPMSALAVFGIGDSGDAVLAAILAEIKSNAMTLESTLQGIDYLDRHIADMRRGYDDPLHLETSSIIERDAAIEHILSNDNNSLPFPPLTRSKDAETAKHIIENVWGVVKGEGEFFSYKDYLAHYALEHATRIYDESLNYAETGQRILDDLDFASEGRAALRSAQAEAIQVRQLANIEANQSQMLSLQAQDALNSNQVEKGIVQFSSAYLQMLSNGFRTQEELER
ncbi:MAG: hypothetical protein COV43_07830 [Deltaproteobacteria bacterium CG11_big_fil_rev_8_21_14_0_20_42_23]|nr:MAG: hypothetical protein COV43_07830 [Deltaproteobacteria bacterium CG11_big_fil_rev_8_21_14_0_20_42_23]PJC63901.1 MAG: hypothetical protein CO021_06985 [Deltaproteobacteria bacterium CG_4_9_14_0_2_um_filter_42_21]